MSDQIQTLSAQLVAAEKQNAILGNLLLEANKRVAVHAANSEVLNEKLAAERKSVSELREAHDNAIEHVKKVQSDLGESNAKNAVIAKSLDEALQKLHALEHVQESESESETTEVVEDDQSFESELCDDNTAQDSDPEPTIIEEDDDHVDVDDAFNTRRKKASKIKARKKAR